MGKNQHVIPHPAGGWQVKGAGNTRATVRTSTQKQAINVAREISRNQHSELVIHRPDGRIRDKDSHGHDPFRREAKDRIDREGMSYRHTLSVLNTSINIFHFLNSSCQSLGNAR